MTERKQKLIETLSQPETAQAFCDSLDIPYSAVFVPQSMSRNAGSKDLSLNWSITFGGLTTDYMQGIGHLPNYQHNNSSVAYHDRVRDFASEKGLKVGSKYPHSIGKKLPAPKLTDVLYSLVMDADVINYSGFVDWAESFGYDTDSISAEKIYRQCLETALKLRQFIDLEAAQEAFQDY